MALRDILAEALVFLHHYAVEVDDTSLEVDGEGSLDILKVGGLVLDAITPVNVAVLRHT